MQAVELRERAEHLVCDVVRASRGGCECEGLAEVDVVLLPFNERLAAHEHKHAAMGGHWLGVNGDITLHLGELGYFLDDLLWTLELLTVDSEEGVISVQAGERLPAAIEGLIVMVCEALRVCDNRARSL